MNNYDNGYNPESEENVVAGTVGAFLFSLAGGIIYFLLHLVGYVASISGLIGAICAVKGYSVFGKKESKKGIIIAAVIALLVIAIAWYFCLAYDVYEAYKGWFEEGEIDFTVSFIEAIRIAPAFLEEPEIARSYFGNLALGLLFALLGSGSYVYSKYKNAKNKSQNVQTPYTVNHVPEQPETKSDETNIE